MKKEEEDFSNEGREGSIARLMGKREWYRFNLPRGNLVNNRSNYPARWHEDEDDDDDPAKRPAELFYLRDAKIEEKEDVFVESVSNTFENDFSRASWKG